MRDKELYTQILGIRSPWKVSGVELAVEDGKDKVLRSLFEPTSKIILCSRLGATHQTLDQNVGQVYSGLLIPRLWGNSDLVPLLIPMLDIESLC